MNRAIEEIARKLSAARVAVVIALLVGGAAGFMVRGLVRDDRGVVEVRQQAGWQYINPLFECEQAGPIVGHHELRSMEEQLDKFVRNDLKKKWGDEVSVYFRELNDGLHFEIGKDKSFYPASLVKVPLLISLLRQAETHPELLSTKVPFTDAGLMAGQNGEVEVRNRLVLGRSYTVDDLLERMIRYSDNVSYDLLLTRVADRSMMAQTFLDLGFPPPYHTGDKTRYVLSAEQYSSCYRTLYNASYLSKPMSEKALVLLSRTDFREGLVAKLPRSVEVAHKFGYWYENGMHQFHDCGIVYYPQHPYLLCVMTAAPERGDTDPTIGEISRFIYQEVDRQHGVL